MKYQCIIYVALFYVFYLAYLLFAARGTLPLSNYQDLAAYFRQSGAWDIIKKGIWQAVIFAVIAAPWLNFSLFRMGHLERLLAEGFQWPAFSHHVDWGFTPEGIWRSGKFAEIVFAPIAVLFQFRFFSLFALIPVIAYFASKSRKESFMARNMHMALFVLAVYLFSTFGMSQHQLRYAMNMLPFIAVFMVQGVVQFSEFVASRFKLASLFVFIIIAALFVYSDMGIASGHNAEFGKIDNEIVDYFKQQPLPRAVINLRPRGEYTRNYYYSPDMFIFKMISAKPEFNPARIPQIVQYIDWENALEVDRKYEGFLASLNSADQKLDVYVVMFNFSSYSNLVVPVSRILGAYNWSRAELENWVVYRRPAS
jgi:hypothetical protein